MDLIGKWVLTPDAVVGDDVTKRIRALLEDELTYVAESSDGWDRLYLDPRDGRYWEETFPESGLHGGGPPRLASIDVEEAKARYHIES
jgi:hypothetical protein